MRHMESGKKVTKPAFNRIEEHEISLCVILCLHPDFMLFPDLGESYEIQARAKERNKLDSKVFRTEGEKNPKSNYWRHRSGFNYSITMPEELNKATAFDSFQQLKHD